MSAQAQCPVCGKDVPLDQSVCPNDGTPLAGVVGAIRQDALIGAQLGEYKVEERIGVGGMGVVYRAVQPVIGKRVAVKVLRPEVAQSQAEIQRLLSEARTVNEIGHRGVIDIFGFGQTPDGRQYFLMEYLNGQALDQLIYERAPLPLAEAIGILDEMLDALGAIHQAGVVHRDLKPSNIFLVAQRGRPAFVKILDFGLSKQGLIDPSNNLPTVRQTRQSMVAGTPEFMAPEQARGQAVSARSDLYAVGVIAFEMFTGRLPFAAPSVIELMMKHINEPAPAPSTVNPGLAAQIDEWVLKLLAKNADERPQSAEVVRRDLKRIRKGLSLSETQVSITLTPSGHVKVARPMATPSSLPAEGVIVDKAALAPTVVRDSVPPADPTSKMVSAGGRARWIAIGAAVTALAAGGGALVAIKASNEPRRDIEPVRVETDLAVHPKQAPPPVVVAKQDPPPPREDPPPKKEDPPPAKETPTEPVKAAAPVHHPAAPLRPKKVEMGRLIIKAKQYSTSFIVDGVELGPQQAGRVFDKPAGRHHIVIKQNEKRFEKDAVVEPNADTIIEVVFPSQ